mgnify:CR=1 FL=1
MHQKSLDYEIHPCISSFGPAFGCSNSIQLNLQSLTDGRRHNVDLHGVTWPLTIAVEHVGYETDLSGGYRHGFVGTTNFALKDYRIEYELGPASQEAALLLSVTGIGKQESYSKTAAE